MLSILPSGPRVLTVALATAFLGGCASHDGRPPFQPRSAAVQGSRAPQPFLSGDRARAVAAGSPKPAPLLSLDDTTRVQIFLDHENFGPGKLDGKPGEFTRKALARYGHAHHLTLPPLGPALLAGALLVVLLHGP